MKKFLKLRAELTARNGAGAGVLTLSESGAVLKDNSGEAITLLIPANSIELGAGDSISISEATAALGVGDFPVTWEMEVVGFRHFAVVELEMPETEKFDLFKVELRGTLSAYPERAKVKPKQGLTFAQNPDGKIEVFGTTPNPIGFIESDEIGAVVQLGLNYEAVMARNGIRVSVPVSDMVKARNASSAEEAVAVTESLISDSYSASELEAIADYIKACGGDDSDVLSVFSTYQPKSEFGAFESLIPTGLSESRRFTPCDEVLFAISIWENQKHLLLSGEKGTGKNVLIETLAWIFQRPLFAISVSQETDKADLLGSQVIVAEQVENGVLQRIEFQPEVLIDAMKCGGILNVDEINFGLPGIMGLLHSVMDDRRQIQVPGFGLVQASSRFMIAGTMNVGYEGTRELSQALQDRFIDIALQPRCSISDLIELKHPGVLNKSELAVMDKVYAKIQDVVSDNSGELSEDCITQRGFLDATMFVKKHGIKKSLVRCVAFKQKDLEYQAKLVELIETMVG